MVRAVAHSGVGNVFDVTDIKKLGQGTAENISERSAQCTAYCKWIHYHRNLIGWKKNSTTILYPF